MEVFKHIGLFFCGLAFNGLMLAQPNIYGPVVGAVSASSAKIKLITAGNLPVNILVTTSDSSFVPKYSTNKDILSIDLDHLKPNTAYQYAILDIDSISSLTGTFKTFPKANDSTHFSFSFGSCTEQHHADSIFIAMKKHQPLFFLHLGDWLYPDHITPDPFYYDESLERQELLYKKRYEMPNLKDMLRSTPMDFVFDDEDGLCDDFSKNTHCMVSTKGKETSIRDVPYPDSLRKMAIQGLKTFFPAYDQVKDQAYHSFVCGNAEIFFLDSRSTRSPNGEVFHQNKRGKWIYKVPKGHEILDSAQMDWLLKGLKHSRADWKFIVSGVTFNKSYKKVLDMCVRAQDRQLRNGITGAYIAANMASMWFAFPASQARLLNFCHDEQIRNVIVLSGDAHTAAIDDGANAGFPELMAGGLAQQNSQLASIVHNKLRLHLWNQGGQGIGNTNFNNAFGKVEVLGREAVRLSVIDQYGKEICSYLVKDGFLPEKYDAAKNSKIGPAAKMRALKNLLKVAVHR